MKIAEYEQDYRDNPPDDSRTQRSFMLSGGDDGLPLVRIPTTDLSSFPIETACGTIGDKAFSSKFIELLQGVASHIHAVGYIEDGVFMVCYMAVVCDGKTSKKIERMTGLRWNDGGSGKMEQSFESE